jgi:hypothetical protein
MNVSERNRHARGHPFPETHNIGKYFLRGEGEGRARVGVFVCVFVCLCVCVCVCVCENLCNCGWWLVIGTGRRSAEGSHDIPPMACPQRRVLVPWDHIGAETEASDATPAPTNH